jgi:hypothetical protein
MTHGWCKSPERPSMQVNMPPNTYNKNIEGKLRLFCVSSCTRIVRLIARTYHLATNGNAITARQSENNPLYLFLLIKRSLYLSRERDGGEDDDDVLER